MFEVVKKDKNDVKNDKKMCGRMRGEINQGRKELNMEYKNRIGDKM